MIETKSSKLRKILNSKKLSFAMEAHSGLSAMIVEETGFPVIWASGLSMSAMTGCRDRNELDVSEVCKIVEWMADHTTIPILVDGDTGGVDINSARILVNKLNKAGAAGVCIEDKRYPKHNSFLDNAKDDLADVEEFCGKIKSMKFENPEFVVVARLEEFISGVGVEEAIYRAKRFCEAGADAILVHSKIKDCSEIDLFMSKWDNTIPVVIVPTKYYKTPTSHFSDLGISLVIWANHNLRSCITSMRNTSRKIFEDQNLLGVEGEISTVKDIFELQKDHEATEAEDRLIDRDSQRGSAIILSGININGCPKSMIKILGNQTYLDVQKDLYNSIGVNNVNVVIRKDDIKIPINKKDGINYHEDHYLFTEVDTLHSALSKVKFRSPTYISYGDIIFKKSLVAKLDTEKDSDIVIVSEKDYVNKNYNEFIVYKDDQDRLNNLSKVVLSCTTTDDHQYDDDIKVSSFIGMIKVNTTKGYAYLCQVVEEVLSDSQDHRMCDIIESLSKYSRSNVLSIKTVLCTHEDWIDHDNVIKEFLND